VDRPHPFIEIPPVASVSAMTTAISTIESFANAQSE